MDIALSEVGKKTTPINEHVGNLKQPFKEKFSTRKQTYQLNTEATNRLKELAKEYVIVAFSAEC